MKGYGKSKQIFGGSRNSEKEVWYSEVILLVFDTMTVFFGVVKKHTFNMVKDINKFKKYSGY